MGARPRADRPQKSPGPARPGSKVGGATLEGRDRPTAGVPRRGTNGQTPIVRGPRQRGRQSGCRRAPIHAAHRHLTRLCTVGATFDRGLHPPGDRRPESAPGHRPLTRACAPATDLGPASPPLHRFLRAALHGQRAGVRSKDRQAPERAGTRAQATLSKLLFPGNACSCWPCFASPPPPPPPVSR